MAFLLGRKKVAIITRWLYYRGGREAGFHCITDSLLCPWAKRAITFSLISANLIRTLSMAPSVSMLSRFDCMCANSSASSGPHNVVSLKSACQVAFKWNACRILNLKNLDLDLSWLMNLPGVWILQIQNIFSDLSKEVQVSRIQIGIFSKKQTFWNCWCLSLANLHSLTFDSYHAPMWMLIISIQQGISRRWNRELPWLMR